MKKDDEFSAGRADEEKELELLREYFRQLVQLGINFRQDWVFRIAFGRVESIPFLRGIMNGVFRNADEPLVDSIKIKNPFSFGVSYGVKDSILDVAVEDESGNQYDVELQTCNHANFRERIVYYLEKLAAGQLAQGETYDMLRKVVGIVFVDFPIWSELDCKKIKNLTPDLEKKLKETQFETIKLMSIENRVVFSDCLTIHFVRIPQVGEPLASNMRDPQLIDWLKAFRFPDSTSAEELLQMERRTPDLKELRNQMYQVLTTPAQRDYIEESQRFYTTQQTILKQLKQQEAEIRKKDAEMLLMFCGFLAETASYKFNVPVSEVEASLEGLTLKELAAVRKSLASTDNYDEFVKIVSEKRQDSGEN